MGRIPPLPALGPVVPRDVALKMVLAESGPSDAANESIHRFLREVRSAAELDMRDGLDARDALGRAIADLDACLAREPNNAWARNDRGNVHYAIASAEAARGCDPRDSYRRALADFDEAEASTRRDEAFTHLAEAVRLGAAQASGLIDDPELVPLHADPRWRRLVGGE